MTVPPDCLPRGGVCVFRLSSLSHPISSARRLRFGGKADWLACRPFVTEGSQMENQPGKGAYAMVHVSTAVLLYGYPCTSTAAALRD